MSARLRNIIEIVRVLDSQYASDGTYGPVESREVILVGALARLAEIVDNYIEAQGDHVARERAYQTLFEAVRVPTEYCPEMTRTEMLFTRTCGCTVVAGTACPHFVAATPNGSKKEQ